MEWLTACRPARWRAAFVEFRDRARLSGFEVDDQLVFGRLPDRALGVTMLPLSRPSKAVDMPDRGSYCGPGLNSPSCSTWPRQGRPSVRWSRRAMIPSPLLRGAAVAALAALAIIWPGMVSARAQAQPRESAAQTSLSGSYLAARHAGDQRDVAAAASYYRAALRGDPRNNELLGRTFLAVLANGEVDEGGQARRARPAGRQERSYRAARAWGARD